MNTFIKLLAFALAVTTAAAAHAQVTGTSLPNKTTLTSGNVTTTSPFVYTDGVGLGVRKVTIPNLMDFGGWGPLDTGVLAGLTLSQGIATSGTARIMTVTGGAHTTLAASTELSDVVFNLNRNVQFSAGTLTTNRSIIVNSPTLSFSGASTLTTASTMYISGPPIEGTNATMHRAYGLHIDWSAATTATTAAALAITSSSVGTTTQGAAFLGGRVSVGQATPTFSDTLTVDVFQYGGLGFGLRSNGTVIGNWYIGSGGAGSYMQLYGASSTVCTQIGRGDNTFNMDMAPINILMSGDTLTNLLVVNGTNDRVGVAITTSTPHSSFQTGGSYATAIRATASSASITATDHVVTGTGSITLTLPTAASITGREYIVKNIGGGSITAASAGGTIDGASTQTIVTGTGAISSMKFKSDGTNWIITY